MMRLALVLALLAALVAPAHARDAGAGIRANLSAGRAAYAEQDYREAIRALRPIIKHPAATRAQKVAALELVGLSMLIIGQTDAARATFEDLLALDPGYVLTDPSQSPKLRRFFEEVKRGYLPSYSGGGQAALEHTAPGGAQAGRRLELAVMVTDGADAVASIALLWRRRGLLEYREQTMSRRKGGGYQVAITPPEDRAGYIMEYYLEARGPAGAVVARAGGPDAPLALALRGAASAGRAWYGRWYVWAGAAVLGVGVTAAVIAASADEAPEGSLPPGFAKTTPE